MSDTDVASLKEDIRELKEGVDRILYAINGNGTPGIHTRLALLEHWRGGVSRFFWIVIGAAATVSVSSIAVAIVAVIKLVTYGSAG